MSVIALPTDLHISRMSWGQRRNDTEFRSTFGAQALESAVPLWAASITVDKISESNSGPWKTVLMQLKGRINQLALYDIARPAPRGTMRGVMTLSSAEAQGSTSLDIVTSYGTNLLSFPEAFDNAPWFPTGTSTVAPNTAVAPDGTTTADTLTLGISGSDRFDQSTQIAAVAGNTYTFSCWVDNPTGTGSPFISINTTTGIGGAVEVPIPANAGLVRYSATVTYAAGVTGNVRVMIINRNSAAGATLRVWGAKLEAGALTDYGYGLTLLKGDLLGLGSGLTQQVVMVVADATSTGQGLITVTTEPPLRNAFSAAAAVTWDKPAALFRSQSSLAGWDYEQTFASGFKLDLLEDVRP